MLIMMQSPMGPRRSALVPYQLTFLFFFIAMNNVHGSIFEWHMVFDLAYVSKVCSWEFVTTCLDIRSCNAMEVYLRSHFCCWITLCGFELLLEYEFISMKP